MSTVIDANMILFADKMGITSSRMINDYGLKTVDEIIETEAAKGNTKAVNYASEMYNSPEKLIKIFKLTNVENKFVILDKMDDHTRLLVLPLLEQEDLVMGLYFFTQEKLLKLLTKVSMEELVNVALGAFPLPLMVQMFTEDDMAMFFQNKDLEKYDVIEQLKLMPPDVMKQFVERKWSKFGFFRFPNLKLHLWSVYHHLLYLYHCTYPADTYTVSHSLLQRPSLPFLRSHR